MGRRPAEVRPDADLDAEKITVRFPASVVGVAVEWPSWQAVITVDAREVASSAAPS